MYLFTHLGKYVSCRLSFQHSDHRTSFNIKFLTLSNGAHPSLVELRYWILFGWIRSSVGLQHLPINLRQYPISVLCKFAAEFRIIKCYFITVSSNIIIELELLNQNFRFQLGSRKRTMFSCYIWFCLLNRIVSVSSLFTHCVLLVFFEPNFWVALMDFLFRSYCVLYFNWHNLMTFANCIESWWRRINTVYAYLYCVVFWSVNIVLNVIKTRFKFHNLYSNICLYQFAVRLLVPGIRLHVTISITN